MLWNLENSTYYDKGKRAYGHGDKIPEKVIAEMGKDTLDEYMEKGWIVDGKVAAEAERDILFAKAESRGLKPHYKAGTAKLRAMIEDRDVLQALKQKAFALGIEVRDDMMFAELKVLVDEKKADEPDS